MQHTKITSLPGLVLMTGALASFNAMAEEAVNSEQDDGAKSVAKEEVVETKYGGSLSLGYQTNIYHPDDHRSKRALNWNASFNATRDKYSAFLSTGAYRSLEDKTGDFFTDSVIGLSYSNLAKFGETVNVSMSGQLTIPTSEHSRKQQLNTAFRLSVPVSFKVADVGFCVTPRVRKNFHQYKTIAGESLNEWIYSISACASYSIGDFSFNASLLGGNSISYQGTRRSSFTYAGNLSGSYKATDYLSLSLSASSSGVYTDAERGTLGNIDLFDSENATYVATATFSF
ncbi:conserved hypothetical protein [Vibrio nigripulchritudo SO65]|uniref:hypothetical protein n=1 Tax=Vibrio nigripulchritudo TaxID=28173 RepID=UPI0003B1F74C|nr:hypothetical protein [Vibrio nigripulchritudo]CCN34965.1 conserved hypothetical protein [Vibrio nigripulchritudo AM115]CCN43871.1 conserved hypothetical protein [Vibrio nigripulchritudo FTn2]CCN67441.1 conserved hypothetical protein [Vibrio nigripulchritudo POn4]CCN79255.1 conserved hypothetical protein [Vibrio nigripulchritudo SO65]